MPSKFPAPAGATPTTLSLGRNSALDSRDSRRRCSASSTVVPSLVRRAFTADRPRPMIPTPRRQRWIDHGCNASRRLDNLLALRSCSLRRGHLLLLFLPTLIEHRRTALPACLHRERRRSQVPDGRRTSAPAHQTRTTALPPSRTDAKSLAGYEHCRSCRCQRHRRAQRKFRRLTYPAKPTRRLFAQLLKPLLICSSCVLLSTFHPTLFTFFDKETNFIREGLCPKEGTRVRVLGVYFFNRISPLRRTYLVQDCQRARRRLQHPPSWQTAGQAGRRAGWPASLRHPRRVSSSTLACRMHLDAAPRGSPPLASARRSRPRCSPKSCDTARRRC